MDQTQVSEEGLLGGWYWCIWVGHDKTGSTDVRKTTSGIQLILQEGTSIDKVTNNAHRAKADRKSIKNITKEYVISFFSSLSVSF